MVISPWHSRRAHHIFPPVLYLIKALLLAVADLA